MASEICIENFPELTWFLEISETAVCVEFINERVLRLLEERPDWINI